MRNTAPPDTQGPKLLAVPKMARITQYTVPVTAPITAPVTAPVTAPSQQAQRQARHVPEIPQDPLLALPRRHYVLQGPTYTPPQELPRRPGADDHRRYKSRGF